jgi:L-histidine Nalpha-methyltransferase
MNREQKIEHGINEDYPQNMPIESRINIEYLGEIGLDRDPVLEDGQDVIRGLTGQTKTLPAKYFYDSLGSALFEEICTLPEYYPTRAEDSILDRYAEDIAATTGICELIELGSGSSTKTRRLLTAYQKQYDFCKYVPIDISESIVKTSVIQLQQEYPNLLIQGLIGTYEQALEWCASLTYQSKMIFFLGSSIGNFSADECDDFLAQISTVLQRGDYFLLGIDLQKPQAILEAAYNDARGVTAEFNRNMLAHLNGRFQGNFCLENFIHKAIYNTEKSQIEMYLISQKYQRVNLDKLKITVEFQAGESLLTEISRKFTIAGMAKSLEAKQLKTMRVFTDRENLFGLLLCQKS